jgi:tRNA pseudouridine38-40 synthase
MDDSFKVKLTIAYDGTAYSGWQTQLTGIGVQQKIEEALQSLFGKKTTLYSSSRTDSGVHALGMAAHCEVPARWRNSPPEKIALAINAYLPADIRIMSARRWPKNRHARFDAKGKQYRYYVWNAPGHNPLLRTQAWHVARALDLAAMRKAAAVLVGKHDFRSFAANRNYVTADTVRTLWRCDIKRNGPLLTFVIEGDGFLYKMCRGIVGTLAQIGLGKYPPEAIGEMLSAKDRRQAGMTAPAHGLVLWKVFYARRTR